MKEQRICIIGAGFAGRSIARELKEKGILGHVTAFIDDDPAKIGSKIDGIPVYGPIDTVTTIQAKVHAHEALIAIPGIGSRRLRSIYKTLKKANFDDIRILPGVSQIVDGEAHLIQTREFDAQDLLRRKPVTIFLKESLAYLRGRRVCITGAGGSIGSELARQLLSGGAQRLYLFDHSETALYEIEKELNILQEEGVGENATIVPVVGELQDRDYTDFIVQRLKADVIFHCAAYKHVPMMEKNPVEAIKNNLFGTKNLVNAARRAGVSRFVLISTDKAVEPVSIYGISKMLAEEVVIGQEGPGEYMVVRFGNVLGSQGSIIPLFRAQILKGGPVTLTHPHITRFFMTIPEAASLVLKTGGVGKGPETYILDMGEPIPIKELAEQMIRFYGFEPERDIRFHYIGLRPGEKLEEKLYGSEERPVATGYPGISKLKRTPRFGAQLWELLAKLQVVCYYDADNTRMYRNRREMKAILQEFIPTFTVPENEPQY